MDLNSFFDALEEVAQRLFRRKNSYDNLKELISLINEQI